MSRLTSYNGASVDFSLPFWFMDCGSERSTVDEDFVRKWHNTAVDSLYRLSGVRTVCLDHQCWVRVEFACAPALLPRRIRAWQKKLERFLKRWKRTLKPKS